MKDYIQVLNPSVVEMIPFVDIGEQWNRADVRNIGCLL